jgi:hypothetical protein
MTKTNFFTNDFFVYYLDCSKFVLILDQETTFLYIHGYT